MGFYIDDSDLDKLDAMKREIREETGINVDIKDLIFYKTFYVFHPDRDFLYHYFILDLKEEPEITLSPKEHKNFSWVSINEALTMPLILDEDHCIKDFYGIK